MATTEPLWLQAARSHIGQTAIEGAGANPYILGLYALCGHPEIRDDNVAWCAAEVGGCLNEAGIRGTGSLLAASYKSFGEVLEAPRPGALAVWDHHVAIVSEVLDEGRFKAIGGNQGHSQGRSAVTEAVFNMSHAPTFRWPVPLATAADLDRAGSRISQKGKADVITGAATLGVAAADIATGDGQEVASAAANIAQAEHTLGLAERVMGAFDKFGAVVGRHPFAFALIVLGLYLVSSGKLVRLWRTMDHNHGHNNWRPINRKEAG